MDKLETKIEIGVVCKNGKLMHDKLVVFCRALKDYFYQITPMNFDRFVVFVDKPKSAIDLDDLKVNLEKRFFENKIDCGLSLNFLE